MGEEEVSKGHYSKIILFTLISAVIILIIASIIYVWQVRDKPLPDALEDIFLNNNAKNPLTNNNPHDSISNSQIPSENSGLSSGSSAGGGGSSGSSLPGTTCNELQISYAIQKITKEPKCLEYNGENCINGELNCTAEIYNLDYNLSGNFKIEIIFTEFSQNSQAIHTEIKDLSLEPRESQTIEGIASLRITNPNLDCSFNTLEICA